jgi:peptidyl-prolyl cis-trans isomerase NIMA-interacting 1
MPSCPIDYHKAFLLTCRLKMSGSLPTGWEARHSKTHDKVYYLNVHTGATQWDVPTEPAAPLAKPATVRASHLLVKHAGSRRPASWRNPNITISKEEAITKLKGLRDMIVSGAVSFEELASKESDCSSASRGGDLGPFGPGQMQKPFEDATYALKVGELSGIVDVSLRAPLSCGGTKR